MSGLAPVVLLHGSVSSGAQWRALAGRLAAAGHPVHAPDLCGYGAAAGWGGGGAFSLWHEAAPVRALLAQHEQPAHIVAHSYGGAVALHVARLHPRRVASLTLIEPVAFHLLEDPSEPAAVAARITQAVACGDYMGGMESFIDYWNGEGAWAALPVSRRVAMAPRLAKVLLDFHAALSEPAAPEDFRTLRAPTLLVRGDRSPAPPRRVCELLAAVLPDARLETIQGAGHMCPLTHADQVNGLVVDFLVEQSKEKNLGSRFRGNDGKGANLGSRLRGDDDSSAEDVTPAEAGVQVLLSA